MMLATFPAVRSLPPVTIWKNATIAISARKMPTWRIRDVRTEITSRDLGTVSLRVDMVGFLLLRHVLHEDLGGRIGDVDLSGDAPLGEGVDAVADAQQFRQLRRDHDHALALRREPIDERVDLVLRSDVDAAGGLVEDQ